MLVALSLENLLVAGRQHLENTLSRRGVGELPQRISTMPIPRTFCLYQNWADSTSPATEPGTAALAACAPLPASLAVKDADQSPPESCTTGPGGCDVSEERVGKKGWGRLVFSALMKNWDRLCRLSRGYSRPASQLVSFQAWRGKSSNACPVSAPSSKAQPFWL